jgi:flagellar basal-body rod modification protein FlgD
MATTIDNSTLSSLNGISGSSAVQTKDEAGSADRFLKLLVAQMQNQDPLNPMDNAQVTSQMAQINTVNGIEKLNTTVQGLSGQFMQMQAMQGAALVGHDVIVEGNAIDMSAEGVGQGGFDLAGPADSVKVDVLNSAGRVVDTLDLKAQDSGRHSFNWDPAKNDTSDSYTFRVTALSGSAPVTSTSLMRDMVSAVSTGGDSLQLELVRSGTTPYAKVKAFN